MKNQFYNKLEILLKKDSRFVDQEGDLLKSNVIDCTYKADKKLIELLLSQNESKKKFFSKIKDVLVFNINDFTAYIQDKNFLADSYTKYRNKIGLNIDGKFLNERKEVALVWPFKDCVLEGGMTKEDEKRKEIFFNEILAQDEIDKLLAPKVLTNWKRYTQDGVYSPLERGKGCVLKRDEDGTIRENLIIKGNNLLALHSLKQQFQNKIKLIYIDPPYNTGNDSFGYNDNFNHSTWLTFMKNRLEVARDLLREDGSIYVQLDYNEIHYCKVLMDEVFGRENFRREISVSTGWPLGFKASTNNWIKVHDILLFYTKSKNYYFKKLYKDYEVDYEKRARKDNDGKLWVDQSLGNINKNKLDELIKAGVAYQTKTGNWRKKQYLDDMKGQLITDMWSDILPINSQSKENVDIEGQKSEELIKRIIDSCTENGDIILDFFLGSGTTAAVVHKMGRQYIGVEQLDYDENDAIIRLQNVIGRNKKVKGKMFEDIEFDQSGISKAVNWKGGGDFVYCELMQYNEQFVEKIKKADTTQKLLNIWKDMKSKGFLNYNIDIKKFDETIDEFKKFSLDKQKRILFDFLNKNQLYVGLSEIEDKEFGVGEGDKKINGEFYGK